MKPAVEEVKEKYDAGNREDENGYRIIGRLLKEAPKDLRLMVVVNAFYVNLKKVEAIIKNNDYRIIDIVTKFLNPSKVYIIKRAL